MLLGIPFFQEFYAQFETTYLESTASEQQYYFESLAPS
jgi:hypothetical protein